MISKLWQISIRKKNSDNLYMGEAQIFQNILQSRRDATNESLLTLKYI